MVKDDNFFQIYIAPKNKMNRVVNVYPTKFWFIFKLVISCLITTTCGQCLWFCSKFQNNFFIMWYGGKQHFLFFTTLNFFMFWNVEQNRRHWPESVVIRHGMDQIPFPRTAPNNNNDQCSLLSKIHTSQSSVHIPPLLLTG